MMNEEKWEIPRIVEAKQQAFKQPVNQRSHKGNQKILKTNKNDNTTCQNLWDARRAMRWGQLIAANADMKKQARSHIKKPNFTTEGTRKT